MTNTANGFRSPNHHHHHHHHHDHFRDNFRTILDCFVLCFRLFGAIMDGSKKEQRSRCFSSSSCSSPQPLPLASRIKITARGSSSSSTSSSSTSSTSREHDISFGAGLFRVHRCCSLHKNESRKVVKLALDGLYQKWGAVLFPTQKLVEKW